MNSQMCLSLRKLPTRYWFFHNEQSDVLIIKKPSNTLLVVIGSSTVNSQMCLSLRSLPTRFWFFHNERSKVASLLLLFFLLLGQDKWAHYYYYFFLYKFFLTSGDVDQRDTWFFIFLFPLYNISTFFLFLNMLGWYIFFNFIF